MGDAAGEVDPVRDARLRRLLLEARPQLAVARDEQVQPLVAGPRDRVDRDVHALEVVGAVERRHEGGDDRVVGDAEPAP